MVGVSETFAENRYATSNFCRVILLLGTLWLLIHLYYQYITSIASVWIMGHAVNKFQNFNSTNNKKSIPQKFILPNSVFHPSPTQIQQQPNHSSKFIPPKFFHHTLPPKYSHTRFTALLESSHLGNDRVWVK